MAYKIGDKAQGGIVFYLFANGENGLVAAEVDQSTNSNWEDALKICSESELKDYRDWFLPSKDILNLMYTNLCEKDIGGFSKDYYWSSTSYNDDFVWVTLFLAGGSVVEQKFIDNRSVRAVRAF